MKISIITPTLNQGKFIEETINSVISQSGDFELEYIIVDGGSSDETIDIIKKYDNLISKNQYGFKCKSLFFSWISENDSGQSDAINKGFRMSSGDVVNWLCSDDILEDGALQEVYNFFENNSKAKVVFGQNEFINESDKPLVCLKSRSFTRAELIKRWDCVYCTFNLAQPSTFVKREILDKVGYLDVNNHLCMDYDWYLRINRMYKFYFIDSLLSKSRFHQNCKSIKFESLQYKESLRVSRMYWKENFPYYWMSFYKKSPYVLACIISAKLRRKSPIFNKFMSFIRGG